MSKRPFEYIEPDQPRVVGRIRPAPQLRQAELDDIVGAETLVLATAIGRTIISGLEMKERRRTRRLLLLIAGGLALFIGLTRTAIILMNS